MEDNVRKITKSIGNGCERIENSVSTVDDKIETAVNKSSAKLDEAASRLNLFTVKNILLNFVIAIVLTGVSIAAFMYAQNYRDGTKIAEEKAVEALAAERSKLEEEFEIERGKLLEDLVRQRRQIEKDAVAEYKSSNDFVIDGATYVANNIYDWPVLETLYQEMPIKKKKDLKLYDILNDAHKEYKKNFGNKKPRDW